MKMAVSVFKAQCTKVFREVQSENKMVEVTNHGKVIALVVPPTAGGGNIKTFIGSLRGTAKVVGDIVGPAVATEEWESCR